MLRWKNTCCAYILLFSTAALKCVHYSFQQFFCARSCPENVCQNRRQKPEAANTVARRLFLFGCAFLNVQALCCGNNCLYRKALFICLQRTAHTPPVGAAYPYTTACLARTPPSVTLPAHMQCTAHTPSSVTLPITHLVYYSIASCKSVGANQTRRAVVQHVWVNPRCQRMFTPGQT